MRKSILLNLCVLFTSYFVKAQQWGYATLIAPQNTTTVTLLDTNSNVIKTWTGLSGQTAYSCFLTPGGYLWRSVKTTNSSFNGGGLTGRVQKVDWNGNIVFDYTISDANQIIHHDFYPMSNGDVLLIVYDKKTATQMTAAGASSATARQLEKIVQLHPTGTTSATIVWQWNLYDHLVQNTNASAANYQTSIVNNPQLMNVNFQVGTDWVHMNGIDYNESLDQIVVSSHNLNEMWVIDHSTTTAQAATHSGGNSGKGGDFLYRWGNPAAYGASGTKIFNIVHDAHWVPDNCPRAGWLGGMNNQGISSSQSAIDLFQSPWNGSSYTLTLGQQYQPTTYGFRHACVGYTGGAGYTSNMGNSQQLPNGNMLICLATASTVYEIDSLQNVIWKYQTTGSLPQASRYSKCFIENPSITINNANPTLCASSATPLQLSTTSSATSVTSYTYQWSPATGLSSTTVANPSVSGISSNTTYTVVMNTGSCTDTAQVTVQVVSPPTANAGSNVTINAGQSTTLTASGGGTYSWNNGVTTATNTVSPTFTSTYTVTVTNAGGCTATAQVTVNVTGGNLSTSASAVSNTICIGSSTQLNANASGGSGNYTYAWSSTPAGFTSSLANPVVSPTSTSVYTVTISDGSTTASSFVTINVNNLPNANAGSNVNISSGQSVTLTASGGTSYLWNNGENTANNTVSPSITTTYTVTVSNASSCTASAQVTVTVSGTALAVSISATDTVICNGESTQLFANSTGGSGSYTYSWSSMPVGFTSQLSNPFVNPLATTMYTVTVNDGTNSVVTSFLVSVNALPPQPTISAVDSVLTSSSTTNNQWFYYGNPISGAVMQNYSAPQEGSYQVQVTDANGCLSPLSDPYQYIPAGIEEVFNSKFLTYPNPTNQFIYIKSLENEKIIKAVLIDKEGRVIHTDSNSTQLDVSFISAGFYILKLETKSGFAFKHILITQ